MDLLSLNKELLQQSGMHSCHSDDEMEQHTGLEEIRALVAAVVSGTLQTQSNAAAALANVSTQKQERVDLNAAGGMGALAAHIHVQVR